MINITVNNKGDIERVHAVAYLLVAFTKGAPDYYSMPIMEGDFDDEMRALLKLDLKDDWNGGEDE